jgi:alpha-amylase
MSQSGATFNADGYGKQYDLNVGQWPNRPIRCGTAQDIQHANTVLHEQGMMVLEDAVIHQYDGGYPSQTYTEIGQNGKPDPALFQKNPGCFVPKASADPVFDPQGNYSFGDLVSYLNSKPKEYMLDGVIRAIKWRWKRFGLDGMRLDDTKGENISVARNIENALGGWNFGECFSGDPNELESWVNQSGGKRTLDFTLHWALQAVCNGGADLRTLEGAGLCGRDPEHAVLFVDTADTDLNNGENIKFNKLWAYLYILTVPAAGALIYAGDYERYGLAPDINNLMWISATFAIGKITWEYADGTLLAWSRDGDGGQYGWSGGLLCGFSTDPINSRSEWMNTPFGPNRHLHDYTGHGSDIWTNADGWALVPFGPNVYGSAQNTVAYAPAAVEHTIPIVPRARKQTGSLTDFSDY